MPQAVNHGKVYRIMSHGFALVLNVKFDDKIRNDSNQEPRHLILKYLLCVICLL